MVDTNVIFTIIVVDDHHHVHQVFVADEIEMPDEVVAQAMIGLEIVEIRPLQEIGLRAKAVLQHRQLLIINKIMHQPIFNLNIKLLNHHIQINLHLVIMIMCQ